MALIWLIDHASSSWMFEASAGMSRLCTGCAGFDQCSDPVTLDSPDYCKFNPISGELLECGKSSKEESGHVNLLSE